MQRHQDLKLEIKISQDGYDSIGYSREEAYMHVKDVWKEKYPDQRDAIRKLGPDEVEPYLWQHFVKRDRQYYLRKRPLDYCDSHT